MKLADKFLEGTKIKRLNPSQATLSNEEETTCEETMKEGITRDAYFATTIEGRREGSTLYIIEDHIFIKQRISYQKLYVRCLYFKKDPSRCRSCAYIEPESLRIVEVKGKHTCNPDPELTEQIKMETEMKQLAATTNDSLRDIFDRVGRKNSSIASRISFDRISAAMYVRRSKALRSSF